MCDLGDIVQRNEMLVNLGSQRMNNRTHRKKRQIFLEEMMEPFIFYGIMVKSPTVQLANANSPTYKIR